MKLWPEVALSEQDRRTKANDCDYPTPPHKTFLSPNEYMGDIGGPM